MSARSAGSMNRRRSIYDETFPAQSGSRLGRCAIYLGLGTFGILGFLGIRKGIDYFQHIDDEHLTWNIDIKNGVMDRSASDSDACKSGRFGIDGTPLVVTIDGKKIFSAEEPLTNGFASGQLSIEPSEGVSVLRNGVLVHGSFHEDIKDITHDGTTTARYMFSRGTRRAVELDISVQDYEHETLGEVVLASCIPA